MIPHFIQFMPHLSFLLLAESYSLILITFLSGFISLQEVFNCDEIFICYFIYYIIRWTQVDCIWSPLIRGNPFITYHYIIGCDSMIHIDTVILSRSLAWQWSFMNTYCIYTNYITLYYWSSFHILVFLLHLHFYLLFVCSLTRFYCIIEEYWLSLCHIIVSIVRYLFISFYC
jgi:hypothetical protein